MANNNANTSTQPESLHSNNSYKVDYATVTLEHGSEIDYATMRASQLAALTNLMVCEDFLNYSNAIQNDLCWLASSLANEMSSLMGIVHKAARS